MVIAVFNMGELTVRQILTTNMKMKTVFTNMATKNLTKDQNLERQ